MGFFLLFGQSLVAFSIWTLGFFLIEALRARTRVGSNRVWTLLFGIGLAAMPALACSIVISVGNTSQAALGILVLSIVVAAFFFLTAITLVCSLVLTGQKQKGLADYTSYSSRDSLAGTKRLLRYEAVVALLGCGGIVWEAVLFYVGHVGSAQYLASESIWRGACILAVVGPAFSLVEGQETCDAFEAVKKDTVAFLDLKQNEMALHHAAKSVKGDVEVDDGMYSKNGECRRVPLHLAEDLPIWKRFSKTRASKAPLTWRDIFAFPHPIEKTFPKVHAFLVALQLLSVALILFLSSAWNTMSLDVGVTVIYAFVLYGYTCRVLCGALIDPQAWFVIWLIWLQRKYLPDLIQPQLDAGLPKRLAQGAGMMLTLMQLCFWLTGYREVTMWLGLLHFSLATPVLADLCAMCGMFFLASQLHLLPESLCADCHIVFVVGENNRRSSQEAQSGGSSNIIGGSIGDTDSGSAKAPSSPALSHVDEL